MYLLFESKLFLSQNKFFDLETREAIVGPSKMRQKDLLHLAQTSTTQ